MKQSTQLFLLALSALIAGTILTVYKQTEAGMLLLGAAVGWLTSGGMARKAAPVLLAFLLVGCTPGEAYVKADRATFDAIWPAHLKYLEADPKLSDEQKAIRRDTGAAWELRIKQAEGDK